MKNLLRLLLKSQHQPNRSGPDKTEKGMTLVELLVGSIMAFLIITPMLAFVVDMLNTDRREQVKSNTEQDIQAAVDFIAQDLSQAIYIYDNSATGIPALTTGQFIPTGADRTPILVFWKRQILNNSLPVNTTRTPLPINCVQPKQPPGTAGECNDTYVLSLVAYYQIKDNNPTWCQQSSPPCPTHIARYQIQDGLKNSTGAYLTAPSQVTSGQEKSPAYNGTPNGNTPAFDITKPEQNVTKPNVPWEPPEVLVNYIDHTEASAGPPIDPVECRTALGNPTAIVPPSTTASPVQESTLKVTDSASASPKNSFYACVDTAKNIARVTIRGNSLRRIQTAADYDPKKSAYFPTATVQVQGLGARGK